MKYCIVLILFIILSISSCKKEDEHFKTPDYKKWRKPFDKVLDSEIPGHGVTYRIIYANDNAFQSEIKRDGSGRKIVMNDGSIVVKEVYDKREDIGIKTPSLFIMVKDLNEPEALNGWEYYMKKPGEEWIEVKSRMCIGCHEAANEKHPYFDGNKDEIFRDYLFTKIAK